MKTHLKHIRFTAAIGLGLAAVHGLAHANDAPDIYVKNCASCHGKDGKAKTPAARKLGVKDLSESKLTDAQIEEQIREGKLDEKKESKMPAFKDKLTNDEIKTLITVVKDFRKP